MRKTLFLVPISALIISSCKKEAVPAKPQASFTFTTFTVSGADSESLMVPVDDGFLLTNNSTNADSYSWDLGNGVTSQNKEFSSSYFKSGTYKITLTAINNDGQKSVTSKQIRVKDYVLRQIIIPSLNFQSALGASSTYPIGKVNLWVEIQEGAPGRWDYQPLPNGTYDMPVVYKSDVVPNVDAGSVPITVNVSQKFIVDAPTFFKEDGYTGKGYSFNIFAQDVTGTYLLTASYWSTVSNSMYGDIRTNSFRITSGFFGSNIVLNGDFE